MHAFYMCKYLGMNVIVFHESRKELRNMKIWKTLFQAYKINFFVLPFSSE
jgi:hypothetical protein